MSKKQATSLARAAALAAAMAAACTDSGESMRIVQNQIPADGCSIPTAVGEYRPSGVIETRSALGYVFTPLIESLLVPPTNRPDVQRTVSLRGADIDVTFPDGFFSADEEDELRDDALTRFSSAFSGTLLSDGGTVSASFVIVPPELLERVDAELGPGESVQVSIKIVAFGDTDGGEVESGPFHYPVTICSDCLVTDYGDCASLADGDLPEDFGNACNPYQDENVACCTRDGEDVCPGEPGA